MKKLECAFVLLLAVSGMMISCKHAKNDSGASVSQTALDKKRAFIDSLDNAQRDSILNVGAAMADRYAGQAQQVQEAREGIEFLKELYDYVIPHDGMVAANHEMELEAMFTETALSLLRGNVDETSGETVYAWHMLTHMGGESIDDDARFNIRASGQGGGWFDVEVDYRPGLTHRVRLQVIKDVDESLKVNDIRVVQE